MIKKIINNKNRLLLSFLAIIISITSFAFTYCAIRTFGDENTVDTGKSGSTVYVNDFAADYYYYTGQNYTYSANMTTPTLEDKGIYGDTNLVEVTLNYFGTDYENKYTGYVSLESEERQNKFVYYKYYPVESGYINIELIDNPFSDHPNDLMFNGWITNYAGAQISYDSSYYTRYLKVPVTYENSKPKKMEINIYARWTKGKKAIVNSNNSFLNQLSSLENGTMHQITLDTNLYQDPSVAGYYKAETITTVTEVTGTWYNPTINTTYATCTDCYTSNHTYYGNNPYQCPAPNIGMWPSPDTYTNDCTVYYLQDANDEWDPNATYYRYANNRYQSVTLSPTIIGTKDDDLFDSNMNMAGYYFERSINRNQSIAGYYNNEGVLQSGNCTQNRCTVYELIQFYDNNSNPNLYDSTKTYFYLTTRDTNIVVMNGSTSSSWGTSFNVPFTLTGIYNGVDYHPTWTVSGFATIAYSNLAIENISISNGGTNSNTAPSSSASESGVFYGNYFNVKLGRNIKRVGSNTTFNAVEGAMNYTRNTTIGSTSNPEKYRMIVESGFYNAGTATYGATTTSRATLYGQVELVFGNDYDRATKKNDKLDLYYSTAASWSGTLHSSNDTLVPVIKTTVKSGSFGSSHYDLTSGVYVGARYAGSHYAPRVLKIEGGHIFNVVGAPSTDSSKSNLTAANIYMTGGEVDLLTGGAGTTTTYGNRILQLTGGKINYGVIGGSNGYDGSSTDGTLTGDSYVYLGGTVTVGDDDLIEDESDLYGVYSGSVFGAGNGNSTYATIGSVKNSNIVINDDATIKQNVYGSGNYGTAGYSATNTSTTNIKIIGGTVEGDVFGSGNNSGSGKENSVTSTINVTLNGGTVEGSIYGGSNTSGKVYGNTNVNVLNGTCTDVYGGGYGENTYVERNVVVTAGDNSTTSLTVGSVYGGSAFGTVNSKQATNNKTNYTTTVNVNNGTITNVFGGGKGDTDHQPLVAGDITVNQAGGTITNVFGGNNANGTPLGAVRTNVSGGTISNVYGGNNANGTVTTTNVTVTGGSIGTVYGGGKAASTATTNTTINGGTISDVFGGGENANVTTKSNVTLTSGTITGAIYGGSNQAGTVLETLVNINSNVPTVYGGNNAGGSATTTNVNLNNGTITTAYGGGNNAQSTTSNITLRGSTVTDLFGGGKSAGVGTSNVTLTSGTATNAYGGSNTSGTVTESHVTSNNANNLTVTSIYGGNNAGGKTVNTFLNLTGGTYTNVFGGGNNADTDYTTVTVNGINVTGNFFGGGNNADVNYNTNVTFNSSTISGDLFGGGNLGEIHGNSTVKIGASTIHGSAYAGGNGTTAVVNGNTNITVHNGSIIDEHVFGGGNAANTGTELANSSESRVNIAGATIAGNVYGGANTAVLYGTAIVNIGYSSSGITQSDINITGTVFGGGEANASGSAIYDFNFIGVTRAITVNIDGNGYNNFHIHGSIFGSGNASSTSGTSEINISNYGTFNDYETNVSIQRTDTLTIKNSAIRLLGAKDRTNEFSDVEFSLSRIGKLILANNSTLFLDENANLLQSYNSELITGNNHAKATAQITDSGNTTINVDNRIYMLEGKNLNIATNEQATAYGRVSGMTFFGMFKLGSNDKAITALYDKAHSNGESVGGGVLYAFTSGSYVLGKHHADHNIKTDGFYSNFADEEHEGQIKTAYIEPSPPDAELYRWTIGEQVTTYELTLTASKFATLSAVELPLDLTSEPNTTFEVKGFNYDDLMNGFVLATEDDIPRVASGSLANTKMALKLETSNIGFINSGSTTFVTDPDEPIIGTKSYTSENSTAIPTLLFYLYHSKNISVARNIGTVIISLNTVTPVDELNDTVNRVNINVTLTSALFNSNEYEGAMTSGDKYDLFASSATNINDKSSLSAYYSLYMNSNNSYYRTGYHHSLVSNKVFKENTKITMIDLRDNEKYYYIVDSAAVTTAEAEISQYGECFYELANFIKMGSTSTNNKFNESRNAAKYYDSTNHIIDEEFIFIVNFEDADITENVLNNSLFLELRNGNQTLISVLGIQRNALTYNIYNDTNAIMDVSGTLNKDPVYIGDTVTLNLTGNFTQPIVNSLPIIDTTHFDKKPGVKITMYDSNNNQLNNSSLLGLSYEVDGVTYYPRMDGSVRIPLTDKVANILKRIHINTENLNLTSGNYTLKVESFTSPDGIYYGTTPQDTLNIPFTIINNSYGLKVTLTDNEMMVNKTLGYTLNENNMLNFKLDYSSAFENPNIHVKLYRREYNTVYDYEYSEVNLSSYVSNNLDPIPDHPNEYMFIDDPEDDMHKPLYLKTLLKSGTYKFVFSLYDGDNFIGDCFTYVIIK